MELVGAPPSLIFRHRNGHEEQKDRALVHAEGFPTEYSPRKPSESRYPDAREQHALTK
jgi:hypothetical protein